MTASIAHSQSEATVPVSAVRIASMLRNRGQSSQDLADLSGKDLTSLATEDAEVSFMDLITLAKHFKRPWPYLLVDEVEEWRAHTHDHRTMGNIRVSSEATEVLFDIVDGVYGLLETAAEVFDHDGAALPTTPATLAVPAAVAGRSLRSYLGVTEAEQLASAERYAALRLWGHAVQAKGIFAFQRSMPDAGVRAFSLSVANQSAIVTSSGDTPYARVFSMLHELTHLALRSSGLCDLDRRSAVESYCNAVAASCLLPHAMLAEAMESEALVGDPVRDDMVVRRLSRRLGASQAAILIALGDYKLVESELLDELERRRAERRPKTTKGSGGPTYYDVRISRAGSRLIGQVFEAVDARIIEQETAGALLDVKNHQLDRLRERWREVHPPNA